MLFIIYFDFDEGELVKWCVSVVFIVVLVEVVWGIGFGEYFLFGCGEE